MPLSQSSPKGVHPIPTMATRSRIPLLAHLCHFSFAVARGSRPRLRVPSVSGRAFQK